MQGLKLSPLYNEAESLIQQWPVLTPPQERLLTLLADYQYKFAVRKLVFGRECDLRRREPKYRDGININRDLYGVTNPINQITFEELVESMPTEYLRFFHETRLNSPFVVGVTTAGLKYLRMDTDKLALAAERKAKK